MSRTATNQEYKEDETLAIAPAPVISRRVKAQGSPAFKAFYKHKAVNLTIDTGAETNMIKASVAHYLGVKITTTKQTALQADGITPLEVIGETSISLSRNDLNLQLEALIVADLDVDVLAGTPFMTANDIAVRPARYEITIHGNEVIKYGHTIKPSSHHAIRRAQVLRGPPQTDTIWPNEVIELDVPPSFHDNDFLAIEPRVHAKYDKFWPTPDIVDVVDGKIRLINTSDIPQVLKKNEHFCQILPIVDTTADMDDNSMPLAPKPPVVNNVSKTFSSCVSLDPDSVLPNNIKQEFSSIMLKYDDVFDPAITGYNHAAGHFEAVVNMGSVEPPQRKGRIPQYSKDKLVALQETFDKLETVGVFKRPSDADTVVEYLNPSFLVKKASGGHRLVTACAEVVRYCKPSPSLMPDVDNTLRSIACWKYIIITDLTKAFYQIPLSASSMKYCGVVTPYKGVRVYCRSAMGMPGSETALEELMCMVLGDLLQEGAIAKLADDLYCGGNTFQELLNNWERVLQALSKCSLKLSASKTIVCPRTASILGWIWKEGTITASPHRIASLSLALPPTTVKGLRSYIGAYKVLGRVLPGCSALIAPLDEAISGLTSQDKIEWSEDLLSAFHKSQQSLEHNTSITLPRPEDQLWIVTDGSVKLRGLGSTLYVSRGSENEIKVAGFYSAKPKKHQVTWLPCEIEALGIAGAISHFSPYIIQSKNKAHILTDSKPCVQAYDKLCRGEFSASPRVTSFLSTASRYQVTLQHLSGTANIPSDFASRNAPECSNPSCQICTFIALTEESVVRQVSIDDIKSGRATLPYTSRNAWRAIQHDCQDLRRAHAHLEHGTRPSRKATNCLDVKRYLQVTTISKDGLLVVPKREPLAPTRECIVVPRNILPGILSALHIKLNHPSKHQLKVTFARQFYGLNVDAYITDVSDHCHTCASIKKIPDSLIKQSSEDPPDVVGVAFAADVLRRNKQIIFVLRETVTSYTVTRLLDNEQHETLRDAIVSCCLELRPIDGPNAVIRVDSAPGLVALRNDSVLAKYHISLDYGRIKNINKNPVAERAIQELEEELLKAAPAQPKVSRLVLSVTTARLNARIRSRGLSAREMFMLRDQFSNDQLPVSDRDLIESQSLQRTINHPYSERSKAPGLSSAPAPAIHPGDLVYLIGDKHKSHARDRYLVSSVDGEWCFIKKFVGSTLRASSYKVKVSECFSVPSHHFSQPPSVPDGSHSDVPEAEYTPTPVAHPPTPPEPPEPPDVLASPYIIRTEPPPTPPRTAEHGATQPVRHEQVDETSPGPRTSSRQRAPPSWMKGEEWELN